MDCTSGTYGGQEMLGKVLFGVPKATDHEEAKVVELAHGAAQWRSFVSRVVKLRVTHEKNSLTFCWS